MLKDYDEIIGSVDEVITSKPFPVFDDRVIDFLNDISKQLLSDSELKQYPDIVSMAYFIRKASLKRLKGSYECENNLGVGLVFHITPSNIPVQFFHSLVVSLIAGNSNIVRMSGKVYKQTGIICECIRKTVKKYSEIRNRICLIRYDHNKELTDYFSSICDARIIWGGNETITNIRLSPLQARAYDVVFADRFSVAVMNSSYYIGISDDEKNKIAQGFYYDTFFSDQNACNSPRLIAWVGEDSVCESAKKEFWSHISGVVKNQYTLNDIAPINKLINECSLTIHYNARVNNIYSCANLINVVDLDEIDYRISSLKGNCGLFMEINIRSINELLNEAQKDWQTLAYLGYDPQDLYRMVVETGTKGIDRIVPIGRTGVPSLQWDGVDFVERLSRIIVVE